MTTLLIFSSDAAILGPLSTICESNGRHLEFGADAWDAMARVQSGTALDLLLLDLVQCQANVLQVFRTLRHLRPALPVVLIGRPDDDVINEELIRQFAFEYVTRPIKLPQLEAAIERSLKQAVQGFDVGMRSDDVEPVGNDRFFIGVSPMMRRLRTQLTRLAETSVPVLILGESGSGRETIARLVHRLSVRSGFEFAKVNCAALPRDLLEQELFGYEQAGTTAGARIRHGKVELCGRGTLYLDEITELPLSVQSNLLQVLEEGRFNRPGTADFVEADVRILASSSADVERAVSESRLRRDLIHHMTAYTVQVPSLRERKEELPFLSRHFMHRLAKHYGLSERELSPTIIETWQAQDWPGNLRELERSVKRYLMAGDRESGVELNRVSGPTELRNDTFVGTKNGNHLSTLPSQSHAGIAEPKSFRSLLCRVKSEAEKNAIAAALEKTGWNRKAAARLLKVSYRTVLYKIEQYKMTPADSLIAPTHHNLGPRRAKLAEDGDAIAPEANILTTANGPYSNR